MFKAYVQRLGWRLAESIVIGFCTRCLTKVSKPVSPCLACAVGFNVCRVELAER
jgi:hypothetical protein